MTRQTRFVAALAFTFAFGTPAYAQLSGGASLGGGAGASAGASAGGLDAGASIGGGNGVDAGASTRGGSGVSGSAGTSGRDSDRRSASAGLDGSGMGSSAAEGGAVDVGSGGDETAATEAGGTAAAPSRVGLPSAGTPDVSGDRRFTLEYLSSLTVAERARILSQLPWRKFRRLLRTCRDVEADSYLRGTCNFVATFPR